VGLDWRKEPPPGCEASSEDLCTIPACDPGTRTRAGASSRELTAQGADRSERNRIVGIRTGHRGWFAGVAAVGILAVGLGTAYGTAADPSVDKSSSARERSQHQEPNVGVEDGDYESTLELSDGRKINVRLVKGTGVQERHTSAGSDTWSKWKTLYKSKTDLCQGVDLAETNGTVSLIADFGLYCYDGEPPTESVAGVGTGDLTDWDIDITEDFDGWEDTTIADDGSKVLFVYNSDAGLYSLRWDQSEGFGKIDRPDE
jgi:hypothetical protein